MSIRPVGLVIIYGLNAKSVYRNIQKRQSKKTALEEVSSCVKGEIGLSQHCECVTEAMHNKQTREVSLPFSPVIVQ